MSPDLSTFAKVRAVHDRTDSPGEKAAAAGRMEALARAAGMSVAEAVSKLDAQTSRTAAGADWSAFAQGFADAFRETEEAFAAADAPDAPCQRRGLPIYDPNKVECWRDVAEHCWQLDWIIPKAHGGKFLTKEERARLKALARHYGSVKNSTADWLETVLARCEAARQSWRDRGKAGVCPEQGATKSDIEKAADLLAAAKRRKASKLDEPQEPPAGPRNPFEALFNSPEFRAQQAERQRRDAERRAAALAECGSEDAVFAETEHERALEAACRPLIVRKPIIGGDMDTLLGWDGIGGGDFPPGVHAAVAAAYPLPDGPREAWEEHQRWEHLYRDRAAFFRDYGFPVWVQARQHVVEEALNTLPARSMNDLRARLSWRDYLNDLEIAPCPAQERIRLATLRADIERMGARLREQDTGAANALSSTDPVQNGQMQGGSDPIPPSPTAPEFYEEVVEPARSASVQSGQAEGCSQFEYPARRTNADKRRDVAALLDEVGPLTDREIARRAGVSPTTVGTIRRARAARHGKESTCV